MQKHNRCKADWLNNNLFDELAGYKKKHQLHVALCTCPSNIDALYGQWLSSAYPSKNIGHSYYYQEERPSQVEKDLFKTDFVYLLTARYAAECIHVRFKSFLNTGLPILAQPPAADINRYKAGFDGSKDIEVLFIGNCWPFKWDNIKKFVPALKREFNDRFQIYGQGWPEGLSKGSLGSVEDTALFSSYVSRAKICLAFHEPSQILSLPTSTNERVFKLLSQGAFVISDPCSAIKSYFNENEHLVFADMGSEMVEKVKYYLENDELRKRIGIKGQKYTLDNHTYKNRAEKIINTFNSQPSKGVLRYI